MRLEIGPGPEKLGEDWTTVSAAPGPAVDYMCEWGLDTFPLQDGSVDEIYASHVIEHVPWLHAEVALMEAWRVLKPGGLIEIHTIDFAKIVETYVAGTKAEHRGGHVMQELSYRLYATSRQPGDRSCVNWHHAAYDRGYLTHLLGVCGFGSIEPVAEPRGPEKHGVYNLGLRAIKA